MKKTGKLYLIPSMLGDSRISAVIPSDNIQIISKIRFFIVEEVRTARHFLKKADPGIVIDEISFLLYNEHSKGQDLTKFIEPLLDGEDAGILSEAGTPCIADPGSEIVRLAHMNNIKVVPLTGPSSILLALMASGFNGQNFAFHGYLPIEKTNRNKKIREIERSAYSNDQTQIFIETPYRNIQLFQAITEACSDNTMLCVASGLSTESEKITVRNIRQWKGQNPDIHKKPTVFLLYK